MARSIAVLRVITSENWAPWRSAGAARPRGCRRPNHRAPGSARWRRRRGRCRSPGRPSARRLCRSWSCPARSRIPAITGARAGGADRGRQRGQALAQDLFAGDLGVPVGGALFGVPVDRAQQRIDVDEHLLVGAGQQIDPLAQRDQVLAQHRLQLAGVTEGELPQQRSDRRGCIHAAEERLHAAGAHHVEVVDAVRAGAHARRSTVASFGDGLADPDLIRGAAMRDLLGQQFWQPGLGGQASSPAPARRTTRDAHHRTPQTPRRTYAKLAPEVPFRTGSD